MRNFQNQAYLVSDQYKDAGNLNARIQLHERYSTNSYGWFHWVFDQLDLPYAAKMLEIGCGSGSLWNENLPRIPGDWKIFLSDISPGMVSGCQLQLGKKQNHFDFEISNAMTIPFPADSFDAIIANHMLYHVPDRQKALGEIARTLKPDGRFYAATNGENHLRELDQFIEQDHPFSEFTLENGAAQLAPWFKHVEIRYYEDSLVVTKAEPLVAYIQSMIPQGEKPDDISQNLPIYRFINELIIQKGHICIQKSSGLFIGKK